jgi:hypothetical protein
MSDTNARDLGPTPLARVVSTGVSGLSTEIMGLGPVEASEQALARAGMTIDDVDLVEINEAFAAQVLPSARELGVDPYGDKLNVHGGAIAVGGHGGHPARARVRRCPPARRLAPGLGRGRGGASRRRAARCRCSCRARPRPSRARLLCPSSSAVTVGTCPWTG